MKPRRLPLLALGVAVAALAAWKAACILTGPDLDTDAYAHHMIARAILADPSDLSVHWVWLPLFHYAQVPLVALGGTLGTVRWINLVLSSALPYFVFTYVRRTTRPGRAEIPAWAVALFAAVVATACPIVMQIGTTGQPEPLFALLVFGVAVTFEEGRWTSAAVLLAAAVMTRYEAWASLATVGALLVGEPWWRRWRGLQAEERPLRAWLVVALPVAFILGWAVLRRPVDGKWFGFLGDTKQFANDAMHERVGLARDVLYYPLAVPFRVMGAMLPLVPFGIARTVRQQGARFVLVLLACLGFVSLTWVMRSSLGLDRHFVCIAPLYAVFAAQGGAAIADWMAARSHRLVVGRAVGGALAAGALVGLGIELQVWMGFWRGSIARGWPEREALAAYLDALPAGSRIYCDDATLELLTTVDRRRFDRHWTDDPETWNLVQADGREHGPVYVATWRRKMTGHEAVGEIVFTAGADPKAPAETGVAVMRVGREID